MKIPSIRILIACQSLLFLMGCNKAESIEKAYMVVADKNVGLSEWGVTNKYGPPTNETLKLAKNMPGELSSGLARKVGWNTEVKELFYNINKKEHVFWLVRTNGNSWVVASDLDIPIGVKF